MRIVFSLLVICALAAIYHFSGDLFYVAGGSDSTERIIDLPKRVRLICAGIAGLSLLVWALRPSLLSMLFALMTIAGFGLAHNTVRVSGKSYEVVQSFALITITRISVVEGEGDLLKDVFVGFGTFALPQNELRTALDGLKRG